MHLKELKLSHVFIDHNKLTPEINNINNRKISKGSETKQNTSE